MNRSTSILNSPMFVAIVGGAIAALIASNVHNAIPEHPIAVGLVCATLIMAVVFLFFVNWYGMILEYRNSTEGSKARDAYNRLRSNLLGVNKPQDTPFGERYRNEITDKLNGVALWFGDADHPNDKRLCKWLGLDKARPLWTPESYDRCLLLSFLYPLISVFVIWAVTGNNEFFEQAFQLTGFENIPSRVGLVGGILVITFAVRMYGRSLGFKSWVWIFIAIAVAVGVAVGVSIVGNDRAFLSKGGLMTTIHVASSSPVTIAGATIGAIAVVIARARARAGVIAVTVVVVVVVAISNFFTGVIGGSFLNAVNPDWRYHGIINYRTVAVDLVSSFVLYFFIAFVVTSTLVFFLEKSIRYQRMTFYVIYSILMVVVLAISPVFLSNSVTWNEFGPLLLFFGVLVFVNAPLDWITLGVTRALMWRGVERRGLSPIAWGLVDIGIALFLLVILSAMMILGIQLFNATTEFGVRNLAAPVIVDAAVFLNPDDLVAGMTSPDTRRNTEYWWVYATLFSTLLPSWLHLLVASGCFVRGSTRLNQLIAKDLLLGKEGESLLPHIQTKLAILLALQRSFGLTLATTFFFGGLCFVFFVLFPQILPLLLEVAAPLSESDWATEFVGTIANMIGSLSAI